MITLENLKELFMEASEELGDDAVITGLNFQDNTLMFSVNSKDYGDCMLVFDATDLNEEIVEEKPKLTLVRD